MNSVRPTGSNSAQVGIYLGAAIFLAALLISAIIVPELRLLHAMQSLIYVAVILLAYRRSVWGLGAGFAIAALWNAMEIFVTRLVQTGAVAFWSLLRTGHVEQLVPIVVAFGALGHFILIAATLAGILQRGAEPRKWWKFAGGGALAIAWFALIVAFAQPH